MNGGPWRPARWTRDARRSSKMRPIWSRNQGSIPVDSCDALDRRAAAQRRLELKKGRSGVANAGLHDELVEREPVEVRLAGVAVQPEAPGLERAEALLQRLGERAADGHRLADRLHLRAEHARGAGQLLERPARHLGDDVVDRRLEAGRRLAGDVVRDLVERVPDGEPRGDLRDREAGRLRRKRRRPADTRVHLDDDHARRWSGRRRTGCSTRRSRRRRGGCRRTRRRASAGTRRRRASGPAPP